MTNSKTLFYKLLDSPTKKRFSSACFFFSRPDGRFLPGDKHYSGTIPPCAIVKGCEAVTTSQYATIGLPAVEGGISVALLGAIYYLVVLIISIAIIETKSGFLKSFWLDFLSQVSGLNLVHFSTIVRDKSPVPLLPRFGFLFHIYFYTCKMAFNVIQFGKLVIFK